MSMYDTARSLKLQEQQRKIMAKHGTWPNATDEDSVMRKIRGFIRAQKRK